VVFIASRQACSGDLVVTVGVFDNIVDAHVALGRLQAEDIPAVLADQHLVQTDWLYSLAVGGIKLQVEEGDEERARQVLSTDYSSGLDSDAD
jgi:hypothetical protein